MLLWVIRHADAVRTSKVSDDDRPLSAVGIAQAHRLARYFQRRTHPSAIWSSPLVRARQTAETIASAIPSAVLRFVTTLGPGASVRGIIDELQHAPPSGCVLVGHEPDMSGLVSRLLSGDDSAHVRFFPSTVALLESQDAVRSGSCRLLECIGPEVLESLLSSEKP